LTNPAPCLQCNLGIGAANDALEIEADRAAEHVIRMAQPDVPGLGQPVVRRSQAHWLNRDAIGASADASASVYRALESQAQPLPQSAQEFFAPRFGRDFSQVRLHTNAEAASSAVEIGARAYATGNDLVFAPDRYQPETMEGRRLLAHELAHVAQQQTGVVRCETENPASGDDSDNAEPAQVPGQKSKTISRPSSKAIWDAYQDVGYMKWKGEDQKIEVWKFIGGRVGKLFQNEHSCAARVSYSMNYGGDPINKYDNKESYRNDASSDFNGKAGDDKNYVVGAPGMGKYMAANYGPADLTLKDGMAFIEFQNGLNSDQTAIFVGSGHCGLVRKYGYRDPYVLTELPVQVWKLNLP
jgi:hypothetical protein